MLTIEFVLSMSKTEDKSVCIDDRRWCAGCALSSRSCCQWTL